MSEQETRVRVFRSLLREWRATPYFADEAAWRRWVEDFGRRVDDALAGTAPVGVSGDAHHCPVCGGCRVSIYCCFTTCSCEDGP